MSYFEYLTSPRMTSSTVVTAVHNLTVIVDAGYNFITLSDQGAFTANPGDVIGLANSQSSILTSSPSPATNLTDNSSLLTNTSNKISNSTFINATKSTLTSSSSCYPPLCRFSLYGFLPSEVRTFLRFMASGEFPLRISIRDKTRDVTSFSRTLTVQRPLENLLVFYENIVRFNSTHTLGFRVERGTNASCAWTLHGRRVDVRGLVNESMPGRGEGVESRFNYTHDVPGEFTFVITCTNLVSNVSEDVPISVRRNISSFNASLCFASFTYEHAQTCWKADAFGDRVEYKWIIGGHVSNWTFKTVFWSFILPGSQNYANVIAMNVVSKETLVLWFTIVENPLSILVSSSLTTSSLSVVFFAGILSWKDHPNGTAFYQSYAVNISERLRLFIHSPTFRVKVGDILIASNVSNATLLNHTFPLAGSTAREHYVYFEATGHPEMNRKKKITIMDEIKELRINCPSEIIVNQTYTFRAWYAQGSDVICNWSIASWKTSDACQIDYNFREQGNVTIHVIGGNSISSSKAVLNISVILPQKTTSTVVSTSTLVLSSIASNIQLIANTISAHTGSLVNRVTSLTSSVESTSHVISQNSQPTILTSFQSQPAFQKLFSTTADVFQTHGISLISPTPSLGSTMVSTAGVLQAHDSSLISTTPSLDSTMVSTAGVLQAHSNSLISPPPSLDSTLMISNGVEFRVSQTSPVSTASATSELSLGSLVIHGPRFIEVGKDVTFNVSIAGSDLIFTWTINNTSQNTTNSSISTNFNHPGKFLLSVNVSNGFAHQDGNISVFVQTPVSGLHIKLFQRHLYKNVEVLFSLRTGTDVLFWADFGDGSRRSSGRVPVTRNVTLDHQYEKPGEYYINITVFNHVSLTTDTFLVFVRESCLFESVNLDGVSRNLRNFAEADDIVVSVTTVVNCSTLTQLQFSWIILRINSGISEKVPVRLQNTLMNESTLRFPASQLSVGVYKVIITVNASLDGTSISSWGIFRRILTNLIVICSCGSHRTTPVDEPLTLHATVTVDNAKSLVYEWFCDEHWEVTCFRKIISRNSSIVHFPGNFLELGETYNFVVKVTKGTRQGVTSHLITVGESNTTLELCLR